MAIGITCASLIFIWVEDEVNYNSSVNDQDLVYYVPTHQLYEGEWRTFNSTPGPLAQDMKIKIPGIELSARTKEFEFLFSVNDNSFNSKGRYADKDFIEIYNLKFIEGQAERVFDNPNDIIISQDMAKKLFGENESALGKIIKVNNDKNFVVKGVIKDLPDNVTFSFNWIAPFELTVIPMNG